MFPNFEGPNLGFLETAFFRPGVFTSSIKGLKIQIKNKLEEGVQIDYLLLLCPGNNVV